MVTSTIPSTLTPFSWSKAEPLEIRDCVLVPVKAGELCYAVALYSPPKRSKWKPRTTDDVPPLHLGRQQIVFPRRELALVVKDVRDFNERAMLRLAKGKRLDCWAVTVRVVCGFDETAQVVFGGGA